MPVDPALLSVFLAASLALLLAPGPAVLFVVARSIDHGRSAGVVASLGLGLGNLVHVIAVTAGLSAVLASSALAYSALKYAGAAFLVLLGLRKLLRGEPHDSVSAAPPVRRRRLFLQAAVVNVLNPKVALFFLAFLPQFTDPARGAIAVQLGLLGAAFVALGVATDVAYGLVAGTASAWLRANRGFRRAQRLVTGSVYTALGLATALAKPSR